MARWIDRICDMHALSCSHRHRLTSISDARLTSLNGTYISSAYGNGFPHVQMDGLTSRPGAGRQQQGTAANGVLVLAATNCPWDLDAALRRRLEKRIYIPLPDAAGRRQLLERGLAGACLDDDVDLDDAAARLEGYSGADIRLVCRDTLLAPIR